MIKNFKSSLKFSFQKGAKPTLKKSESLFHKEQLALVFEKVKSAISSFGSGHSFKKNDENDLLKPLFL